MAKYKYTKKQVNRFWAKVDHIGKGFDVCWNWIASTNKKTGYGQITINANNTYAHRVCYEIMFGEIPGNSEVCHSCDNPACCNPKHLFVGTHLENMQDRDRKGRGVKTSIPLETIEYILSQYSKGVSQAQLSRETGIKSSRMSRLINGKMKTVNLMVHK